MIHQFLEERFYKVFIFVEKHLDFLNVGVNNDGNGIFFNLVDVIKK